MVLTLPGGIVGFLSEKAGPLLSPRKREIASP
jgi:hypothetical protein